MAGKRAWGMVLACVLISSVGLGVTIGRAAARRGAAGPSVAEASTCRKVRAPHQRVEHLKRPLQTVGADDRLEAVVATNCGRFAIRLDARRSPLIVNSFVYLARSGFYEGLRFDRVVPDFVVQGGDPRDNGTGGPGYHVTEPPPRGFRYRVGTVAMGKTESEPRGRAGSDFFIVFGQGGAIKPEYAVLGQVTAGRSTVKRIGALGGESERPSQIVKIDSIRIRADR